MSEYPQYNKSLYSDKRCIDRNDWLFPVKQSITKPKAGAEKKPDPRYK